MVAALLVLLTGCEDQEAVPLDRSIGMAIALPLVGITFAWWGWVALDRLLARRRSAPPRVEPTPVSHVIVGVIWAAIGVSGLGIASMLNDVAFAYERARYDLFSWDDIVVFAMFLGGAYVLLGFVLARFSRALIEGYVRPRIAAAILLVIAAVLQVVSRNEVALWIALGELAVAAGLTAETRRPRVS